MTKFRIEQNRFLRIQVNTTELTAFNIPSSRDIVESLFISAGYSRVEVSSTARYHKNFVDRAGSLNIAAHYLATSPYRELLELFADNSDKQKPGWILKAPDQRRALRHLDLLEILQKPIPQETREYINSLSDQLPPEFIQLLEQRIVERGFLLPCQSCSFNSWYPAEHLGQTFECPRCFHLQVCISNPLWLYKMAEVVFQGFADNMQVPLLTLNYLRWLSHLHFDWVPDSNVFWVTNSKKVSRNIDILCLCNGRVFLGEAKSNNDIPATQFTFYEDICQRVNVDSIVFATSEPRWNERTTIRIENLKKQFRGQVLVLTAHELYSNVA